MISVIPYFREKEVTLKILTTKGLKLELPILFGAFYGLRWNEALNLKRGAISFERNTITIRHTVKA